MQQLRKLICGLSCVLVLAAALPGAAAAAPPTAEERIAELEKQVQHLTKDLAAAKAAGTVPADRLAELERRLDLLSRELEAARLGEAASDQTAGSRYGLGPSASKIYAKSRGVSIGGYGEANYRNPSNSDDSGNPSGASAVADLQRVVLYFGYKWSDRWLFNSEIEYEHATTGEGDEEEGEISIEFANIDWLARPEANGRAGLVLMPVGFLNELHEPVTFFGVRRPLVEQVIIPTTWREMGVGGFGDVGPVSWRAYLTTGLNAEGLSGEGWRDARQGGSESLAEDFALVARADWTIMPGLLVGASGFIGDSGQGLQTTAGDDLDARATLYEAHAEWRLQGLTTRVLGVQTGLDDAAELNDALGLAGPDGAGEKMRGWYAEAGFDVLSLGEPKSQSLSPFFRYESFDTQSTVSGGFVRDPARNVTMFTAGVAWKPIPQIVITADFQNVDNAAGTGVDQANLGIGFIF